jgi:hypothetical protein
MSCFEKYSIEKHRLFETSLIFPPSTDIYCTYELDKKKIKDLFRPAKKSALGCWEGGEGRKAKAS